MPDLVRYVNEVRSDAKGDVVALPGQAFLRIVFHPASCSMMFGGYAPTSLAPIVWQPGAGQHARHYEGLIGGVRFTADYPVQRGWKIIIYAC